MTDPLPIHQLTLAKDAGIRALAVRVKRTAQPRADRQIVPRLREGTVISNDGGSPPTCTVQFDTTTPGPSVPGIRYAWPLVPIAGDLVYVATLGADAWIVTRLRNDGVPAYLETVTTITGVSTEALNSATFLTVALEAGRRYRVEGHCRGDSTQQNTVDVKIRYAAGTNPTTSSTIAAAAEGLTNTGAGGARSYHPCAYPLIGGSSGNRTFGMSIHVGAGGGTTSMVTGNLGVIYVAISAFN